MNCEKCGADLPTQAILDIHIQRYCPKMAEQEQAQAQESVKKAKKAKANATAKNGSKADAPRTVGRLEVPDADPFYMISSEVAEEVGRILALVDEPDAIENVAILGPHGSGKTSLAKQIAALRESPYHVSSAYLQRSSEEWFGTETISLETGMQYNQSLFVEALETPGATVCINDLLLMQNKSVQNGLNDLLDPSVREVWVDAIARALGRPIRVAPNVLIIATWNQGASYTGNIMMSANIMGRFLNRILMDYPPEETQIAILMRKTDVDFTTAQRICRFSTSLRCMKEPVEVSVRSLLQIAKKVLLGAHIKDAMQYTIIANEDVKVQQQMLAALESIYTPEEKEDISTRKSVWEAWDEGGQEMVTDPSIAKEKAKKEVTEEQWDQAEKGGRFASAGKRNASNIRS